MTWRYARALDELLDELDALYPDRDRASDGGIGDPDHASRGDGSDHNPWIIDDQGRGVVRARDFDRDGIPAEELAEHLRQLGAAGDPRLANWGYVIFRRRIAGGNPLRGPARWNWRPYTGPNTHEHHIHLSTSRDQAGYDRPGSWHLSTHEDPAMTPEQAAQLANVAQALQRLEKAHGALSTNVAEIRRELVTSVPDRDGAGNPQRPTLRWITAKALEYARR